MPRPTRAMYPVLLYCVALLWTLAPREGRAAPATPRASAAPVLYKVPVDASPVLGPDDALVTVVVFGGLECRFSQALLQTLVVAQRAQARDLRIVWKHFPLAMHSRAVPAAVAAVEAHKAGKFWQFMDRLRTARYALDDASLERAAVAAGVPGGRVLGALKAGSHRVAVLADQLLGTRLQVSATPTFFVNGLLVPGGAIPSATLQVHLNQALREARKKLGEPGATRKNLYERIISGGAQPGPQAVPVLQKLAAPVFSKIPIAMPGSRPSADALRADGDKTVRLVDAPAQGPEEAIVTAILFANFRCGNLTEIWNAFQEVARAQPGLFRLHFLHHALNPSDALAWQAGQAALVAHAAGKFWELAELLMQNRYNITPGRLTELASDVGLDAKSVATALRGGAHRSALQRENEGSRRFLKGNTACPVLWINGHIHSGYLSSWRVKNAFLEAAREVRGLRVQPMP